MSACFLLNLELHLSNMGAVLGPLSYLPQILQIEPQVLGTLVFNILFLCPSQTPFHHLSPVLINLVRTGLGSAWISIPALDHACLERRCSLGLGVWVGESQALSPSACGASPTTQLLCALPPSCGPGHSCSPGWHDPLILGSMPSTRDTGPSSVVPSSHST